MHLFTRKYYLQSISFVMIAFLGLSFSNCSKGKKSPPQPKSAVSTSQQVDTIIKDSVDYQDYVSLFPILFHQKSGEYRGLCYQAFQLARLQIMNDLKDQSVNNQRAVVVDIDETVLDNSPYEAGNILHKRKYPEGWNEWISKEKAEPLPGAVEFLKMLGQYRIEVFYVSNRSEDQRESTKKNLLKMGFPVKDDDHLLLKSSESSKEGRRAQIAEHYSISLLMGDNLNDFSRVFENRDADGRIKGVDSLKQFFGKKFILLPNAMYGDWQSALYKGDNPVGEADKWELTKRKLIPD